MVDHLPYGKKPDRLDLIFVKTGIEYKREQANDNWIWHQPILSIPSLDADSCSKYPAVKVFIDPKFHYRDSVSARRRIELLKRKLDRRIRKQQADPVSDKAVVTPAFSRRGYSGHTILNDVIMFWNRLNISHILQQKGSTLHSRWPR